MAGPGRPKGSKNLSSYLKLRSFCTGKEVQMFVEAAKKLALTDPTILKFVLEQLFGKAGQTIDMNVAPQQKSFMELENNLKMLNEKNDTRLIEGEVINEHGTGTAPVQDPERAAPSNDPDPGNDIQSYLAEAGEAVPCDVPHEVRQELHSSPGGADQNSDLPREMGDSGPLGEEGEDNHVVPD
jgi:hypothetical protein